MRAVSTVLDVALFLLLVSAAVGTVVLASPPEETTSRASETVDTVASSTLSVEYELRGETRHAHGTVATLLARTAVANATFDGAELSRTDEAFRETVVTETRARLSAPNRTRILARWTPYRGSPLAGTVAVGPAPPSGVDVHSATVTVPAPVPASHDPATGAAGGGYDSVARPVASAVADGLLPDNRVDASASRESPTAIATTRRYRTVAEQAGVSVTSELAGGSVGGAHDTVVDGLTRTLAGDMRTRFDTPEAAAEAVRTGRVTITVRRWEP